MLALPRGGCPERAERTKKTPVKIGTRAVIILWRRRVRLFTCCMHTPQKQTTDTELFSVKSRVVFHLTVVKAVDSLWAWLV